MLLQVRTDYKLSCGKTTLARLIARRTNAVFKELSATIVGINDVRPIFDEAKNALQLTGRFVDFDQTLCMSAAQHFQSNHNLP
jgi:hypothetical protein